MPMTYRQARLDPRPVLVIPGAVIALSTFLALSLRGLTSDAMAMPLVVALFTWMALLAVGPLGPLARLWFPPVLVTIDTDELRWAEEGGTVRVAWASIGGVAMRETGWRYGSACSVFDRSGAEIGRLPFKVKRLRRLGLVNPFGDGRTIQDLILEARPDVFDRLDGGDERKVVANLKAQANAVRDGRLE